MPLEDLDEIVQMCSGANMARDYEDKHRLRHLRRLGMVYREATNETEPDPVRTVVDPAELPLIARAFYDPAAPEVFKDRPYFWTAGDKEHVSVWPGMDAVVLILAGGERAVIYPAEKYGAKGFRCPESLWSLVAAQLKYLPGGEG